MGGNNMTDLTARYRFRTKFKQYQPALHDLSTPVVIGDASGVVNVPGRTGYIYVRSEAGNMPAMEVFNKKVTPAVGMEVFIGYTPQEPNLLQVIDTHTPSAQYVATTPGSEVIGGLGTVPPHAWSHAYLQPDQLLIQKRSILPGKLAAATLTGSRAAVRVYDDIVWVGGQFRYVEPRTIDLTSHIPATAGHSCYVAISVDATGAIAVTDGADIAALTPALTDAPAIPSVNVLLGFVRLYAGMYNVQEYYNGNTLYTDFLDPRSMLFRLPVTGGSGDFFGPGSAADGDFVQFDGTTGKLGKDSGYKPSSFLPVSLFLATGDMIYLPAATYVNHALLALGATATAISYDPPYPPSNAIDGNDTTFLVTTSYNVQGWVAVDLGAVKNIAAVRICQAPSYGATEYDVQASTDGINYSTVDHRVMANYTDDTAALSSVQSYRYFRILITAGPAIVSGWILNTVGLFEQTAAPSRLIYVADGNKLAGVAGIPAWVQSGNRPKRVITSATTITAADSLIVCNAAGGFTQPLPAATGTGNSYTIKNIGAGSIVVDADGSETIDGALTQTVAQWGILTVTDCASGLWVIT